MADSDDRRGPASYSLAPVSVRTYLLQLAERNRIDTSERFVCYRLAGDHPFSDIARSLECEVFQEFFGNDPHVMDDAYKDYERASEFFMAVDLRRGDPVGVLRVINQSPAGLKSLNDIASPPLAIHPADVMAYHGIEDLANCWDVGTLAVARGYRGGEGKLISTMLYGHFHAEALRRGIDHAVAILDAHAYRQLTESLAIPFVPLAGSAPFSYLGSESSRAGYLRMPDVVPTVEAFLNGLKESQRRLIEPLVARVIYARGLADLIHVS